LPLTLASRCIFTQRLQGRFITYQDKDLSAGESSLWGTASVITIPLHSQNPLSATNIIYDTALPAGIQLTVILMDVKRFVKDYLLTSIS
jgi:hypothetical protein